VKLLKESVDTTGAKVVVTASAKRRKNV